MNLRFEVIEPTHTVIPAVPRLSDQSGLGHGSKTSDDLIHVFTCAITVEVRSDLHSFTNIVRNDALLVVENPFLVV